MSDEELRRLIDRGKADELARTRIRERWLRQQSAEDATLAGVLGDLAADRAVVALRTAAGRTHQGVLAVGADHCTVTSASGGQVHVRLDAVVHVRPAPEVRTPLATASTAADRSDRRLLAVLAEAVAERPRVQLVVTGAADPLSGTLEAVGVDVLTVRLDSSSRCYVAAQSVVEASFLGSG